MWWLPQAVAADSFMPPAATEIAAKYDDIYAFLLWSSLISFIIVVGGMMYFVFKYKRKTAADKTAYITHDHTLEFLWSFIPFVIFMVAFAWGWVVFHEMRTMPENALEVHVVAKKWDWRFIYKNGKEAVSAMDKDNQRVPATMVVPVGRPVKLIMASEKMVPGNTDPTDRAVLHSLYIPAFRIKQDVVPGRYTAEWFKVDKPGDYHIFCAEFCGASHYAMSAMIKAVSPEDFEKWLASDGSGNLSLAEKGRALYTQKACIGCHSLDGSRVVGPSYKGLYGRIEKWEGGKSGPADDDYIRESILEPNAKIVEGYPKGVMPVYKGQLSDDDITALIEFIKTVK